MKYYVTK